jgi:FkbM family methyltransferase
VKLAVGGGDVAYYWLDGHDEPAVVEALAKYGRQGSVAIDAGANIGLETLLLSSVVGATGMVLSVEPDPLNASKLRTNCNLNEARNVEVIEEAVSNRTGTIAFAASGDLTSHVPHATIGGSHDLRPCVTLDELVRRFAAPTDVSVIKIDVEGHELEVLEGARDLLTSGRPVIIIEVHTPETRRDCIALLGEAGYSVSPLPDHGLWARTERGPSSSLSTFVREQLLALGD